VLSSPSLRNHNTLAARLTYFAWKARDALTVQPIALRRLLGFGQKMAS
jgi:hypothetical protein